MLTFKTQFPIDPSKSIEDLLDCCRIWVEGSPYTSLVDLIPAETRSGIYSVNGESLALASEPTGAGYVGGARYEKVDNDKLRWITEIIGHKEESSFIVSVQLNVDSELPLERLEQGKRPYIVKLLIQKLGGGNDGKLSVSDRPFFLEEHQIDLAADAIDANSGSTMPIVYISRSENESTFINPIEVAKWTAGMAHVMVEPSRPFSFKLRDLVYGENAYGGAVAIYWPDGIGKWLYLPERWSEPAKMQAAIVRKVRQSLLYQRTKKTCNWSFLLELASKRRIEELRRSGSNDIEKYITQFDSEIAAKDETIQRLEVELLRNRYKKQETTEENENDLKTIRLESSEKDLYHGEHLSLILELIEQAKDSCERYSRKQDVFQSIFDCSSKSPEKERILDKLKILLRQYSAMSSPLRADLEELGFEITEEGKHYKLVFNGDERYSLTLSKSGSDSRGGLNAYSELKKRFF